MDEAQRQALRHTMKGKPNWSFQPGDSSSIYRSDADGMIYDVHDDHVPALTRSGCTMMPPDKAKTL